MAQVQLPDVIIREDNLIRGLVYLADEVGVNAVDFPNPTPTTPIPLNAIYDEEVEEAVRFAYQRDYMMFRFKPRRR